MEELYDKVCKGSYPEIPDTFSFELRRVLSLMLQVKPKRRPSTKELLNMKEVKDKIDELYFNDPKPDSKNGIRNSLLNTIRLPKAFEELSKRLPKPNYSYENASFLPKYINLELSSERAEQEVRDLKQPKSRIHSGARMSLNVDYSPRISKVKTKEQSRRRVFDGNLILLISIAQNSISPKDRQIIRESMLKLESVLSSQKYNPYASPDVSSSISSISKSQVQSPIGKR